MILKNIIAKYLNLNKRNLLINYKLILALA